MREEDEAVIELVVDSGVASWCWLQRLGLEDLDADASLPIGSSPKIIGRFRRRDFTSREGIVGRVNSSTIWTG